MKGTMKIVSALMVALMIITAVTPVFAQGLGVTVNPNPGELDATTQNTLNTVLGVLQGLGIFAGVAILMVVGIKYMLGSAEEKAEYKKVLIPYILGAVLLFAAAFIMGIIKSATVKVTGTGLLDSTKILADTFKALV